MQIREYDKLTEMNIIVEKKDFLTKEVQKKIFELLKRLDTDTVSITIKIR